MRQVRSKSSGSLPACRAAKGIARAAKCAIETLESRVLMSVNVTTYHYDAGETGANTNETTLTPANVNVSTFGKVGSLPTDGQIYAQPLIMTGVAVPGKGTQDLVFVATENDTVYAFSDNGSSTTPVWKTSLLQTGETPIPSGTTGSPNIAPIIGITGTPVIDPSTNTLYVVGNFKESYGADQARLYALDITTGASKFGGPTVISGTVSGTGAGSIGGQLAFSPLLANQRTALTLANGQVYVAFASHGDGGNYHGWVFSFNQSTLAQTAVWCDTPNGSQGGIWMSGGGLAVDSAGDLYLTSGNGTFDANTGGSDYAMALVELSPSLKVLDYFSPYNEAALSGQNNDYGCGNAVLLPTQTGTSPDEVLTAGKWGGIYLNNYDTGKLGEFTANGPNNDLGEASTNGSQHNTFSYWNGQVYIGADGEPLKAFAAGNGNLATGVSSQSAQVFGAVGRNGQGVSPTISSDGSSDGILWAIDNNAYISNYTGSGQAILFAYNPSNLGQVYWRSDQAVGGRDSAGTAIQFTTPVVANGHVYVGGGTGLTIYGNIPYAPPPPPPPPPPQVPAGAITGFNNFDLNQSYMSGAPLISNDHNTMTLTTSNYSEATSAIYGIPVGHQNFTAQFTYTDSGGSPPADGMTFMLENSPSGYTALGGSGAGLGYSGIPNSFAAEFNVHRVSSIAIGTDGTINAPYNASNTGSVILPSGDPINVILSYNGTNQSLTETLTDPIASDTYTTIYSGINLSSIVGSGTCYMGFTGGTGAEDSLQTISNFAYYTTPLWLTTTSAATWDAPTHTLTVTGPATITADPGTDEPNIVASGPFAKLTIVPTTSPADIHIGGITVTNGASVTMPSLGSGRSHSNHNVLVVGDAGASADPVFSIDSQSKLDISDNDLIVHSGTSDVNGSSAYAAVEALAATGRNPQSGSPGTPDGQWNGNGLSSSAAAAADSAAGYEKIGLGIVINSTLLTGQLNSWQVGASNENLAANDVIVKYTYLGDYALEGQVYDDDAGILQLEYDGGTSTNHKWATGSSLFDRMSDATEGGLFQLQYGLGIAVDDGPQL